MTDKRYRVAQWGAGHSGMPALRALIEHPTFELVVSESSQLSAAFRKADGAPRI